MPTASEVNTAASNFITDTNTANELINGPPGTVTNRHGADSKNLGQIISEVQGNVIGSLGQRDYPNVNTILTDTILVYTAGQPETITIGNFIRTRAEGFAYRVAASDASDAHVTTAGGVKLYVLPDSGGRYNVLAFGIVNDGLTDMRAAIIAAANAIPAEGGVLFFPKGEYLNNSGRTTISRSNLTLEGEPGTCFVAGNGAILLRPEGTEAQHIKNVNTRGICFRDPASMDDVTETLGIAMLYCDNSSIDDCDFEGLGDDCVRIDRCDGVNVNRPLFTRYAGASSRGSGVTIASTKNITVNDVRGMDGIQGSVVRIETTETGMDCKNISINGLKLTGQLTNPAINIIPDRANVSGLHLSNIQSDNCAAETISITPGNNQNVDYVNLDNIIIRGGGSAATQVDTVGSAAIFSPSSRVRYVSLNNVHVNGWGVATGHHGILFHQAAIFGSTANSNADSGIVVTKKSMVALCTAEGNGHTVSEGARAGVQYGDRCIIAINNLSGNAKGTHPLNEGMNSIVALNVVDGNRSDGLDNNSSLSALNLVLSNLTGETLSGENAVSFLNLFRDNTNIFSDSGTNSLVYGQAPSDLVTKNKGVATILAGQTFVTVNHGLSVTPDVSDIHVTPYSDLGTGTQNVNGVTNPVVEYINLNGNLSRAEVSGGNAGNTQLTRRFWVSPTFISASTFRIRISFASAINTQFNWSVDAN